jgi:hypothetical protein
MNTPPHCVPTADPLEPMNTAQIETDSQTNSWDPELVSRSSSVAIAEDVPSGSKVPRTKEKSKGKTKEKDSDKAVSRVKEEPLPTTLPLFNNLSSAVIIFTSYLLRLSHSISGMRTIARHVVLWGPWSTAMAALELITFGVSIRLWRHQTFQRERVGGFVLVAKYTR